MLGVERLLSLLHISVGASKFDAHATVLHQVLQYENRVPDLRQLEGYSTLFDQLAQTPPSELLVADWSTSADWNSAFSALWALSRHPSGTYPRGSHPSFAVALALHAVRRTANAAQCSRRGASEPDEALEKLASRLLGVIDAYWRRALGDALVHHYAPRGLLAFLTAFRDDARLQHAHVHTLNKLLNPPEPADEESEPNGEDACPGELPTEAVPDLCCEMEEMKGAALTAVTDLLQHLSASDQCKHSFRPVFKRLLNIGQAERHLLEQIAVTVRAQHGGSTVPLPQNKATVLMLQNLTSLDNWTYPFRQAVARYDLIDATADVYESACRDLPPDDARHMQGDDALARRLGR